MKTEYKTYNHLVGNWSWEKTKFLKQSISKIEAKYKSPETENINVQIEITKEGKLITFLNSRKHRTYKIVSYNSSIDNTNTYVVHSYLTLKRFWSKTVVDFQQSTDPNKFSAMYFFPFNKQSGASYNWFERSI